MPGCMRGSPGVRHFGGGPPACSYYFAESPSLPCHLHPRWTLIVAPPPSLSSSLTPSRPASCSLRCQAAAWPAVAVAELDKAPAFPAPEPPPPRAPQVAGRPPAPQAQAALCLAWGRGAEPGPRSFLASAKPSQLSAHCAHCLRCSTPAELMWNRLPGLLQTRCRCLPEGEGMVGRGAPFHPNSPGGVCRHLP